MSKKESETASTSDRVSDADANSTLNDAAIAEAIAEWERFSIGKSSSFETLSETNIWGAEDLLSASFWPDKEIKEEKSGTGNSFHEENDAAIALALADFHENGGGSAGDWSGGIDIHQPKQPPFACPVCLEDSIDPYNGYSLEICNHMFCLECLQNLVKSSSISGDKTVTCPSVGCEETLTANDVRYIFRNDYKVWSTYEKAANLSYIEKQVAEGAARRCPSEHCNYTFLYESAGGCNFACPLCRNSFCLDCKANNGDVGPAHDGLSCGDRLKQLQAKESERREFEKWKLENSQADKRFNELIQKESQMGKTKPCPKCGGMITKNGGCNHMQCRLCKHRYNWSQA